MITTAQIMSVDYLKQTCSVWIPNLDGPNAPEKTVLPAAILNTPGMQDCYNVGELVWISFDRNILKYPVVIGKIYTKDSDGVVIKDSAGLFTSTNIDNSKLVKTFELSSNFATITNLTVSSKANLPANSTFTGITGDENTCKYIKDNLDTIDKLLNQVAILMKKVSELETKLATCSTMEEVNNE